MLKKSICFFFCLYACSFLLRGQSLTDVQFFDLVNLEMDGMQSVKTCVEKSDFAKAKKEYVKYLKQRTKPVWFIDWRADDSIKRKTRVSLVEAERNANNELVSRGIWHKYGKTVDWTQNPPENETNNSEWVWQLNRHRAWSVLGAAYWATGDEKFAKAFVLQLNSWLEQCKVPDNAGNVTGSPWRTLEAGFRMMSCWPDVFAYFLSSPQFDDESIFKMVKSFYEHGYHLRKYYTSNNWLSIEMHGLYTVGVLFPEFKESSEWCSFASNKLYEEEKEQFYPDGSQKELTTGYHGNSLSSIVAAYRLAKLNNYQLPRDYIARIEQAYEYFQRLKMPDGKMPAVNDASWGEAKSQLKVAAELFPKRKDFLYSATDGEDGKLPSYTSTWMPWAGWYVMRSDWSSDALYAFFEAGPYGRAHSHEDKLSFILYAYGSLLITECGNYEYDQSMWREYSVSARAHNVARVDGKDQNRAFFKLQPSILESNNPLSNKLVKRKQFVSATGEYTEGFGDSIDKTVTHCRTLKYVKNKYWLVTDKFIPSDNSQHQYDIWFHFNTDKFFIDSSKNVVYSLSETEANIAIVRLSDNNDVTVITGQQLPEVQGWVSDKTMYGNYVVRPVATPVFHTQGAGEHKVHFVFIPFRKGERVTIERVIRLSSHKYLIYIDKLKHYIVRV